LTAQKDANADDLLKGIDELSPERRALLALYALRRKKGAAGATAIPKLPRRPGVNVFPLSFAQERLWFLDQLMPGSTLYNSPGGVRFRGALDPAALERALDEVVRRHEILRTSFADEEGKPRQVVAPELSLRVSLTELTHLPETEREAEAYRLAVEEAWRPFDLKCAPVLRARLLRLGAEDHVLLVTMHHIISDGWSTSVLIREVAALYEAFAAGRPSPLAELPIQYADYAAWQRDAMHGPALERQLTYWSERLGGNRPSLELPADRPRPVVQSFRGATLDFTLPKTLAESLKELGRLHDCTLFMTLLAGFKALLARYSGQEDILVGTPIAGRDRGEIEGLIGIFINTLVLRTDLAGDPTFSELLTRVREVALGAYAHQSVPFEKLVGELQPERSLSRQPFFQVMFVLQTAPTEHLKARGLTITPFETDTRSETFDDLNLSLMETEQGLVGRIEYNTDIFEAATVARMMDSFATLLESAAAHPEQRLSRLAVLPPAERRKLLEEWNDTSTESSEVCAHHLFEEQAARTPDAVAVREGEVRLTYRELNERANQLARYLRRFGVGAESRVGICVERSTELLVGVLGVLKAGACYLPIDPAYPPERQSFMLEDARAAALLTQSALLARLSAQATRVICLDADWTKVARESGENPSFQVAADSAAYAIYTSGSTGRPKGVQMPHRPLVSLIRWQLRNLPGGAGRLTLQFSSPSFDVSFQEFFSTWASGGTLLLVGENLRRDSRALLRFIAEEGVERLFLPFIALQGLAEAFEQGGPAPSRLRAVITAGEQLQITPAVAGLFRALKDCVLCNQYGPSETHVVTSLELVAVPDDWPALPSIGRPVANSRLYVLDRHRQPAPIGVPGEIYIGGDCLARGYLNRPELTADRFLPDPFSATPGGRMYRTGDVARFMSDGSLEFLGRIDHQVKIRGFRVEPGEVEAALDAHPSVRKAVAAVREDTRGVKRLVAYLVTNPDTPLSTTELRRHLKAKLPAHMIPSAFLLIDSFPLTPSGKVDRRALPAPDLARPELETALVLPRNQTERTLADIWADVLRVGQVGVNDNFFELGGDSILSIQIVARAERAGLRLTVPQLWERPTVAELARLAAEAEAAGDERPRATLAASPSSERFPLARLSADVLARLPGGADAEDVYPLSSMQQGILFHSLLNPSGGEYVEQFDCELRGELHLDAFQRAWELVVERHPALRTAFVWQDLDEPHQVVYAGASLGLEQLDWRGQSPAEQQRRLAAFLSAEEVERSFDLTQPPLISLTLIRLADERSHFVWSLHDIILDGWSAPLILEEVRLHYEALCEGRAAALGTSYPYRDYVAWVQQQDMAAAESFWRETFEGCGTPRSLSAYPPAGGAATTGRRYGKRGVRLSTSATAELQALARLHRVTLNTVLQGAWALLLSRYTDAEEVIFGGVVSGRPAQLAGVEAMAGVLVNTLPARVRVAPDETLGPWLRQLQAQQFRARQYEFTPIVQIQRWSGLPADQPLFESILAFVNYPEHDDGLWLNKHWSLQKSGYPLFVVVRPDEELLIEITYQSARFDEPAVGRMLEHLRVLLEGMVAADAEPLANLPLLTGEERRQILTGWNDTAADFQLDVCFHRRFEAQAKETPEAVAVVAGARRLTYRELNRRANRAARVLVEKGVGPDVLAGLLLERGIDFLTAMLAVFKAGGAYLPLDPFHPARRHEQILRQSRAPLVIAGGEFVTLLAEVSAALPEGERPEILSAEELFAEERDEEDLPDRAGPRDLAYVIFTSGSTGQPKGAMVEQIGMQNHLCVKVAELGLTGADVVAQTASQCFDISVWQFLAALVVGGRVEVCDDETARDPRTLLDWTAAAGVTILETVPSMLRGLLEEAAGRGAGAAPLPALRWLIPTGEALPPELCARWFGLYPDIPLLNAYGPTECSDDITHHVLREPPPIGAGSVPIGRPVSNMRLYVLDARGALLPVGLAGELYAGGVGVGRGYLGAPARTAAVFVPDPFSATPGGRMYRTGDVARFMSDGSLEFLGRIDHQVKIRGFRVELGEIEAALDAHPSVRAAVVSAREDAAGHKYLAAYVVARDGARIDVAALRSDLREKLPEYMTPSAFVVLDELPLTPNGKLDRRALPAPGDAPGAQREKFVPPGTPTEELLADIWRQVLGVERVGVHEDFFELGGHSLLATQVFAKVRSTFQVTVPLRRFFEAPTVAQLAEVVEEILLDEIEEVSEESAERLAG
jgi:amino acid adenylation domain-containing protein